MKLLLSFFIGFLLFSLTNTSQAQSTGSIDSLLCKEWKLVSIQEGNDTYTLDPGEQNDRMIFYFNHRVKSIESGTVEYGTWKYDADPKTLTIVDDASKETIVLQVVKLTHTECVLVYKDAEGLILRIKMASASK
ncbi:MAG: lipocalin family protein [Bacteroidota bacterium]|nr:lipocalin family protein [Bacteroidota bacterium]MDX5431875.1 lipocalin family protein [Bacteroidota bacterium]MDX5470589.1 lipocalin family protein [Bacteroidota bacterium]